MVQTRGLVIALLVLQSVAQAQPDNAERAVASLRGSVLRLKAPLQGGNLRFSSDGSLKKTAKPGNRMGFGLVYVKSATTDGKRLQIQGSRCLMVFDKQQKRVLAGNINQPVSVEIDVQSPSQSDAVNALQAVFEKNDSNQLQKYFEPSFDTAVDWRDASKSSSGVQIGTLEGRPVYFVKTGIIDPPKMVYTPDPEYPLSEKSKRNPGQSVTQIIVDENGDPALLIPSQMSAMAFDFAAFQALTRWKFKPALKDGKPVAVAINVEINFRLY